MYVCICNAVTEDDVHGCMASGACATVRDVKAACGMKPGCGSCTRRLHAMVSEYRTASELADALTGGPLPLTVIPDPAAPVPAVPAPAAAASAVLDAAAMEPASIEQAVPHLPDHVLAEQIVSDAAERGTAPPTAA
ncbi:(2Fe-2S)-binding protein [Actinomadura fibrosa]|uniref:Bacterioferritin-associated ferredoxin n=1 Tax=Actinomadura fibrosa TaxID=111802 RepID=A0ABW2XG20_9ACTN|nr:(2Fe-2S)-binding protein [Actinomadura fibrosa]